MKLHLLHTNDIHSRLENFMRLGYRLRQLRTGIRSTGDHVLTFDIGDIVDRVRPETEATLGLINADLMAALDYDGFVFGNNEGLTVPVRVWEEFTHRSQTHVFGTNVRDWQNRVLPYFQDFQIYEQGQVKIGAFGLTPDYEKPYEVLGVRVLSPFGRAHEAVEQLKNLGCKIIVVLSHLGHHEDRRLAQQVPGIDVILGGHTHQFMEHVEWIGSTAMFQCGKHALSLGHTWVEFDDVQGEVIDVVSKAIEIGHGEPYDESMRNVYDAEQPAVIERLDAPVVHLNRPLEVDFEAESPFANAVVDVLFETYPADIGMMMSGALNACLLPGRITLEQIHGACSTPTRPLLMTLSGEQIMSIIHKAIQPEFYQRPGFGYGFRGSVLGYFALANATAIVGVDQFGADGVQLAQLLIGDVHVEPKKDYRVVTCEFLWLSPVFEEFQQGRDIEFKPPLLRELLVANLDRPNREERAQRRRYVYQRR